ncbi:MAG: FAD-binding oxidoreductase [Leptolyngbya sp. BL-A-14]
MGTSSTDQSAAESPLSQPALHPPEAPDFCIWDSLPSEKRSQIDRTVKPGTSISGIAYPSSAEALATVMAASGPQGILPCGAGSKLSWGGIIQLQQAQTSLLVVSTERLNRLIEHAVGDLTVTVEAGMRFVDLQTILANEGQFLALDPAYPESATIGGIIATADTGSLRQRYNSVRDMVLGLSFVRADGQLTKAGGRVVKNVAGYDLMKLLTGSYGTLGIITQVTFRVYPLPEASQTVVLSGEASAVAQATQTLLGSALTPACADVVSESVVAELGVGNGMGLAIRLQSILPSVQEQAQRIAEVGRSLRLASLNIAEQDDATLWQRLQEHMTAAHQSEAITCKIGIQPSEAVALLTMIDRMSIAPWYGQIHTASGLGRLVFDASTPPEPLLKIRSFCQANSGFLSLLKAPIALKQAIEVWGYSGNALDLMQQLKQQFDPNRRLSPHRFVGGI